MGERAGNSEQMDAVARGDRERMTAFVSEGERVEHRPSCILRCDTLAAILVPGLLCSPFTLAPVPATYIYYIPRSLCPRVPLSHPLLFPSLLPRFLHCLAHGPRVLAARGTEA